MKIAKSIVALIVVLSTLDGCAGVVHETPEAKLLKEHGVRRFYIKNESGQFARLCTRQITPCTHDASGWIKGVNAWNREELWLIPDGKLACVDFKESPVGACLIVYRKVSTPYGDAYAEDLEHIGHFSPRDVAPGGTMVFGR